MQHRSRPLNSHPLTTGPILYWMIREMRVQDNPALQYAQQLALERQQALHVVVAFREDLEAHHGTARLMDSVITGLQEVAAELEAHKIGFSFVLGDPVKMIAALAQKQAVGAVVVDFSPLRVFREWHSELASTLPCAVHQIDAHNIVPCWQASEKEEHAAYTFRPKIYRKLPAFLDQTARVQPHPYPPSTKAAPTDWAQIRSKIIMDESVKKPDWFVPGTCAGLKQLDTFLKHSLDQYDEHRNDPTQDVLTNLSPWLHFGFISPHRVVQAVLEAAQDRGHSLIEPAQPKDFQLKTGHAGADGLLEQLVVRRELSDNFCYYNPHYDTAASYKDWAQESLKLHQSDEREHLYTLDSFEHAKTHDPLWNAAQLQMVEHGKMHTYLRMYWAKKILEWTPNARTAHQIAVYLNDRYELDGRDPNGYTGIAWSIGGIHDRGWTERPIFGKIRYMNYNGAKRKFDVQRYIKKWGELTPKLF